MTICNTYFSVILLSNDIQYYVSSYRYPLRCRYDIGREMRKKIFKMAKKVSDYMRDYDRNSYGHGGGGYGGSGGYGH